VRRTQHISRQTRATQCTLVPLCLAALYAATHMCTAYRQRLLLLLLLLLLLC
jgi:hypothetical protein